MNTDVCSALLADDGFGNLIEAPRAPFARVPAAEATRLGLPPNFTRASGPYAFVVNDWLIGWGCNH